MLRSFAVWIAKGVELLQVNVVESRALVKHPDRRFFNVFTLEDESAGQAPAARILPLQQQYLELVVVKAEDHIVDGKVCEVIQMPFLKEFAPTKLLRWFFSHSANIEKPRGAYTIFQSVLQTH